MHPGSRLHRKEPVRKPDVVANTSTFEIIIYIGFTIQEKLFNFFTRPSSNTSNLQGKTRRARADPVWFITTQEKNIQTYTQPGLTQ